MTVLAVTSPSIIPMELSYQHVIAVVSRLLRNLKEIHLSAENWPALLQVQERLVRLVPLAWAERRDRGLAYAELGLDELALADLQTYLQHCSEAEDAPALRERMSRMGGAANGRRPS